MTVSWGGVGVLWGKNVAFIFVRDSRYTKEFIDANEFFSITFLSGQYRDALNYCGSHSGRDEDKFAAAGLTLATRHNIPYLDEGNFVLLCEKMSATRITEDSFFSLRSRKMVQGRRYAHHVCRGDHRYSRPLILFFQKGSHLCIQ